MGSGGPTSLPPPMATTAQGLSPQPAPCDCSGPDLDCRDFATYSQAQARLDLCLPGHGDVFRLDGDEDGLACEALP